MKTNPCFTFVTGLALILGSSAVFAIEGPADDSPPPPAVDKPAHDHAAPPANDNVAKGDVAKAAKAAFLGVVSAEVPAALADHLDLKPGEGIVVQALMPEGPAAKAGVAMYDVITRIGEQPVGSLEDLTKEVATHQPGDKIHVGLIHKGKAGALDVTLGERPDGMAALEAAPLDDLQLNGIPKDMADRVRGAIQGNLGNLNLQFGDGPAMPQMQDAMRDMQKRVAEAMQGLNVPQAAPDAAGPKFDIRQGAAIRLMDEQGSIEFRSLNDSKEVSVRDKSGKVIWNGPWDTEQDKAAAPDDVRQRIERLNIDSKVHGNGFHLQFRHAPGH